MVVYLYDDSDRSIFKAVRSGNHCLHHVFAGKQKISTEWFSDRGDNFALLHLNRNLQENLSLTDIW